MSGVNVNQKIAVVMGSDSDYETMKKIIPILRENNIDYDFRVISAHRTPRLATEFAQYAKSNGYALIIAGAGMSAHLPGVIAAFTGVPVIGLPLKSDSSGMDGMDALHSVIQMPPGVPVAAVGIDHAEGAARLAVKMISCYNGTPAVKIIYNKNEVSEESLTKAVNSLKLYGIENNVIDLADHNINEGTSGVAPIDLKDIFKESDFSIDSTFAILNLSGNNGINIEGIVNAYERANDIPIIEVPLKAKTDEFNATSHMLYNRIQLSEASAFVGVNSYQNAAHLIARIAGIHDTSIYNMVVDEHSKLAEAVIEKDTRMQQMVNAQKTRPTP